MTLDYCQNVAKVVRDAGCEVADSLHFLSVTQLRFELQTLGNIVFADQRVGIGAQLDQFSGKQRETFMARRTSPSATNTTWQVAASAGVGNFLTTMG